MRSFEMGSGLDGRNPSYVLLPGGCAMNLRLILLLAALAAPPVIAGDAPAKPGAVFKDCDGCPEMVAVPPGSYAMGGTRRITLSRAFAAGKTEISFAQWDACVTAGGCPHRPDDRGWGRGRQPVMNVNWHDAKQYVAWLARETGKSYRLLTEAEWEYAARAGTTTAYYWGNADADICQYAHVYLGSEGCGTKRPAPVASKRPNAFGLYDMLGSLWEWVEDCFHEGIDDVPGDGNARTTGDCGQRVVRGGSWFISSYGATSGYRIGNAPSFRDEGFGFRVARTF